MSLLVVISQISFNHSTKSAPLEPVSGLYARHSTKSGGSVLVVFCG